MSQKPWLAHYDEGVPETIDYPRIPLDKRLSDSAAKHPNHPALIYGSAVGSRIMDATMTYGELDVAVDNFAASLQGRGVKPGDRVTIMLPNCPQFVIAAYATWRIGIATGNRHQYQRVFPQVTQLDVYPDQGKKGRPQG